jgi:hypothetical protein
MGAPLREGNRNCIPQLALQMTVYRLWVEPFSSNDRIRKVDSIGGGILLQL